MVAHAEALYQRVGNERVTRHDAAQQQRWYERKVQHPLRQHKGKHPWYGESEDAECPNLSHIAPHSLEIHLQTGEEEDVVESYIAEEPKAVAVFEDVKSVGADEHSGKDQPHDVRYSEFSHYNRCEQNDAEHNEKDKRRVGNRESHRAN